MFIQAREQEWKHEMILDLAQRFIVEDKGTKLSFLNCTCKKCNHSLLYGYYCSSYHSYVYPSFRTKTYSYRSRQRLLHKRRLHPILLIFEQHHDEFLHARRQAQREREQRNQFILAAWYEPDITFSILQEDGFWIDALISYIEQQPLYYTLMDNLESLIYEWRETFIKDALLPYLVKDLILYIVLPFL